MEASDLVQKLIAETNARGAIDLAYEWLTEALRMVRGFAWTWNLDRRRLLTLIDLSETGITFTWVEGDDYITSSAPVLLGTGMTGRYVQLGDHYYRVVDYGIKNASRVYVDTLIKGSATDQTLTFSRFKYIFRTNKVLSVFVDKTRMVHRSNRENDNEFSQYGYSQYTYIDNNSPVRPSRPKYPPTYATAAGTLPQGTYYYFWTRFCEETGIESLPGPKIEVKHPGGLAAVINYASTFGASDDTSYKMRLYRSQVNPTTKNCPFFVVGEKAASSTSTITDNAVTLYSDQYWWGEYCELDIGRGYTSERKVLEVYLCNSYGWRVLQTDEIYLGDNAEILEMVRHYIVCAVAMAKSSNADMQQNTIHMNRQLAYLFSKDRSPASDDISSERRLSGRGDFDYSESTALDRFSPGNRIMRW